jgi:hypothetical protein
MEHTNDVERERSKRECLALMARAEGDMLACLADVERELARAERRARGVPEELAAIAALRAEVESRRLQVESDMCWRRALLDSAKWLW